MVLSDQQKLLFSETVWNYYRAHARSMPWRDEPSSYNVLISEYMLQQTQVSRVIPKFLEFTELFPDVSSLAGASLASVLKQWQGLGYNRRAKYLHETAHIIVTQYHAHIPSQVDVLTTLPGIGTNTAGAIVAYAYNKPIVFVETNIRSVYFHHFLQSEDEIDDRLVKALVAETLDHQHPRDWYWALMDYGAHLKAQGYGRIAASRHYVKQAPLDGSMRQMRGQILKYLSKSALKTLDFPVSIRRDKRFVGALAALRTEGFIEKRDDYWCLTGEMSAS